MKQPRNNRPIKRISC